MTCRLYTTAQATCIHGAEPRADERERTREALTAGVSLTLDTSADVVSGFLPIRRAGTPEGSAAFVETDGARDPLIAYRDGVERALEQHDNWGIRRDTPVGRLLDAVEQSPHCPRHVRRHVRRSPDPIVGVPDLQSAVGVIRALTGLDPHDVRGEPTADGGIPGAQTVVVTQTGSTGGVDTDLTVHVDESAYDAPMSVESIGESPLDRVSAGLEELQRLEHTDAAVAVVDERLSDLDVGVRLSYDDPSSGLSARFERLLGGVIVVVAGLVAVSSWFRLGSGPPIRVDGFALFLWLARRLPPSVSRRIVVGGVLAIGFCLAAAAVVSATREDEPSENVESAAGGVIEPVEAIDAGIGGDETPETVLRSAVETNPAFDVVEHSIRRRLMDRLPDGVLVAAVVTLGAVFARRPSRGVVVGAIVVGALVTLLVNRRLVVATVVWPTRRVADVVTLVASGVRRGLRGVGASLVGVVTLAASGARRGLRGVGTSLADVRRTLVRPLSRATTAERADERTRETAVAPERLVPLGDELALVVGPLPTTDGGPHQESPDPTYGYELLAADETRSTNVETGEPDIVASDATTGDACIATGSRIEWFRAETTDVADPRTVRLGTKHGSIEDVVVGANGDLAVTQAHGRVSLVDVGGNVTHTLFELERVDGERVCHLRGNQIYTLDDRNVVRVYKRGLRQAHKVLRVTGKRLLDTVVSEGYLYVIFVSGSYYRIGRRTGDWQNKQFGIGTGSGERLVTVDAGDDWVACASRGRIWYWPGSNPRDKSSLPVANVEEVRVHGDTVYAAGGRTLHRIDTATDRRRAVQFESAVESFDVIDRTGGTPLVVARSENRVVTAPIRDPAPTGLAAVVPPLDG